MTNDVVKTTLRIDEKISKDMDRVAKNEGISKGDLLVKAFKFYKNYCFANTEASFLNDNILSAMQGITDRMEMRLNHKTNQVLSELAIQVSIMEQILGNSLDVDGSVLSKFRQNAVEFLKTNQRILRMDEVIE